MYERILIPTDGSDGMGETITEALDLTELAGATIHALYVLDTRDYSTLPEAKWLTIEDELRDAAERAVADVERRAAERGITVETATKRGVPHEEILAYADEHDIDIIVMGTHGRTGLGHFLLGSVTEKVIRSATRPVLVVRIANPETKSDDG